jgi:ribosomal-protein-alanine N-acetyltransferase
VTVELRPLRTDDVARCAELEKTLFPADDPWSEHAFRSELAAPRNHYVGAYADDLLVGYAGLSLAGHARALEGEVHTIGVDPRWQGQGIGKLLLEALLKCADEAGAPVFLEVRTDNTTAIRLYEKYGFEQIGLRRRYYQPSGADAYTMARPRSASD